MFWKNYRGAYEVHIGNAQYKVTVSPHIHYPDTLLMWLADNNSRATLIEQRDLHTNDPDEAMREALAIAADYFQRARNNMGVAIEEIREALS